MQPGTPCKAGRRCKGCGTLPDTLHGISWQPWKTWSLQVQVLSCTELH